MLAVAIGSDVPLRVVGAGLLVVLVAALVHRGGALGRAAPVGLLAGLVPFGVPVLVQGNVCGLVAGSCAAWCLAACTGAGAAAGGWLGARSAREPDGAAWLAAGLGVAACCGAMGCVCAGASGVLAMLVAAVAFAPVTRAVRLRWA
jgi:hypothetical protein